MPASSVHYQPAFEISRTVVVPGIGLNHAIAIGAAITGRKCAVCNDVTEHWKASDMCELVSDSKCNDESGIDTDSGTECTEDDAQSIVSESAQTISKFSRKRTREKNSSEEAVVNSSPAGKKSKAVVSNQRPASANAMVSSLITEFTANPKSQIKAKIGKRPILQITDGYEAGHIAASSHHRLNIQNSSALPNISTSAVVDKELQAKILKLEAQLESSRQEMVASRQELDMVVRKGDRRFNEEMRLRKEWNSKMSEWMAEKADLVSQLRDYRERNELLKTESYNCLSVMSSLSGKLKALLRADHKGGDSSLGTSAISSMQDAQMSPGEQLRNYPKLFCVVCQSNTAEMVFSDCGHMCLCFEHFTIMNEAEYSIGGLKTCPVCKKRNNSVVRVRGLF